MALPEETKLRQLLGEDIPASGSASDTLFSDEEIFDLLDESPDIERAALNGWRIKAARLSSLVDNTEGNVQRKFSQLLDNASDMIKIYQRNSRGNTEGRARVGRIRRPGVEWH